MIEATTLTKRYGAKTAVDGVSFVVRPGQVTGFLGPNGAGKSTTMRMIVGLDRPTSGRVTVNGMPYSEHRSPLHEVGALLEAKAVHTGRSARNHLRAIAATHGIPRRRVDEVIDLTGLHSVAGRRVGGFSLGMGQRLGLAAALLGDPATLILDEPVNGLDPEGVLWVRGFVRQFAAEGRTVLLSSHLMSEMALTADHIIVIGKGRVIADAPVGDIVGSTQTFVRVRSPRIDEIARRLSQPDVEVTSTTADTIEVRGLDADVIGDAALQLGVPLHELTPVQGSLEDAYMSLTRDEVEYRTAVPSEAATTEGALR
ncbi:ABC transporter ATP-binding protein [Herbiconiux liukaitaii]|uniref:ABC transporter ATP-binding protein n=1 Tax=Herbiconiux liukaitaii TaxID=3342799 RepID=UPI0035B8B723